MVGGGPAGATLACRLATLGHSVVVVERERFPRAHVGESVSPGVWSLLETIGARDAVEAAGFPRAVEARVRWGGREEGMRDGAPEARVRGGAPEGGAMRRPATRRSRTAEPGITVDRGVFDRLLLDQARSAGARILQPAKASPPIAIAGGWEVPVASADGCQPVRARFLADASGRARLLGGRRRRTAPRTVALHALWAGVESHTAHTAVEARPQSWLWGAHLPGGAFRAMAFVEPELVRRGLRAGERVEDLYRELLGASSLFSHLLAGAARLQSGVRVCDATCYADENPIDASSAKVGEAAFAIDPLSSSGVQTAIQTGVAAAIAIRTILSPDGDPGAATAYFREHQRHAVERHQSLAARSYEMCAAYAAEPFWRRRSGGARPEARSGEGTAPSAGGGRGSWSTGMAGSRLAGAPTPPPAQAVSLQDLLGRPVSLSPRSALVLTPCVVGERVEFRRALCAPALPRPVAYLGDTELAPLLDRLSADRTLREAVEDWARSIPVGAAYAVAGWLVENGLLEDNAARRARCPPDACTSFRTDSK